MHRTPKPGQSFADLHPDVAKEWDYERNAPLLPTDIIPGSAATIHWICSNCGNAWPAPLVNRTRPIKKSKTGKITAPSGCPKCAHAKRHTQQSRDKRSASMKGQNTFSGKPYAAKISAGVRARINDPTPNADGVPKGVVLRKLMADNRRGLKPQGQALENLRAGQAKTARQNRGKRRTDKQREGMSTVHNAANRRKVDEIAARVVAKLDASR